MLRSARLLIALVLATTALARPLTADEPKAVYMSADRTVSYRFLEKIAKYTYLYPRTPLSQQTFPPDTNDLIPNAVTRDCSTPQFLCITWDDQAFAVPRARLTVTDSYVVAGNRFSVVDCLRGFKGVCQVALIRSVCYYNRVIRGCVPTKAEGTEKTPPWLLYFIFNEDFGVTSFGISAPSEPVDSSDAALGKAKEYILVGAKGILHS